MTLFLFFSVTESVDEFLPEISEEYFDEDEMADLYTAQERLEFSRLFENPSRKPQLAFIESEEKS